MSPWIIAVSFWGNERVTCSAWPVQRAGITSAGCYIKAGFSVFNVRHAPAGWDAQTRDGARHLPTLERKKGRWSCFFRTVIHLWSISNCDETFSVCADWAVPMNFNRDLCAWACTHCRNTRVMSAASRPTPRLWRSVCWWCLCRLMCFCNYLWGK